MLAVGDLVEDDAWCHSMQRANLQFKIWMCYLKIFFLSLSSVCRELTTWSPDTVKCIWSLSLWQFKIALWWWIQLWDLIERPAYIQCTWIKVCLRGSDLTTKLKKNKKKWIKVFRKREFLFLGISKTFVWKFKLLNKNSLYISGQRTCIY